MNLNKVKGCLIGGAVGDALGYQIEFKKNIKDKEVTRFDGTGIISDDTQMSLFTANALIWRETRASMKGIAMEHSYAIYVAYLDWLDTQNNTSGDRCISWIKDIKELNIPRAPGNTCISALSSGKKGTIEKPINDSKGCGGIMRIAPIGLYMKDSISAGKLGAEASAITHGHPLSSISSYVFTTMIYFLLNEELNIEESLNKAITQYKEKFNNFDKENTNYFLKLVDKAVKLSKENLNDIDAIKELGEGWVAEETFAIALYSCLKYKDSFEDAIVCAVNHGGDSDSTGAVAGNIIGTYLGYDKIPSYYIDNLELKDVILELATDLATPIPISEYSSNRDEKWEKKYLIMKGNYNNINITESNRKQGLSKKGIIILSIICTILLVVIGILLEKIGISMFIFVPIGLILLIILIVYISNLLKNK